LDEFDAVAKRRDDIGEIGELKRLVTVLLQAVDDWPSSGLLLAATNHPDLLDPAAWRRFEMIIQFPLPDPAGVHTAVEQFLGDEPNVHDELSAAVEAVLSGASYSEIERVLMGVRRRAAVDDTDLNDKLREFVVSRTDALPLSDRVRLAIAAIERGEVSQRQAHDLFDVSRDVIRREARRRSNSSGRNG
jgi:SpoVK/Ycf46/Vps4 family AAA+-type ATPase